MRRAIVITARSWERHHLVNILNINLKQLKMRFAGYPKESLGMEAIGNLDSMHPEDIRAGSANAAELKKWAGLKPSKPIRHGLDAFARCHCNYYQVS